MPALVGSMYRTSKRWPRREPAAHEFCEPDFKELPRGPADGESNCERHDGEQNVARGEAEFGDDVDGDGALHECHAERVPEIEAVADISKELRDPRLEEPGLAVCAEAHARKHVQGGHE